MRLNADGRYDEVITHYQKVTPGTQNNFYVKKYYNRTVELSGKPIKPTVGDSGGHERTVDDKGTFIAFGYKQ